MAALLSMPIVAIVGVFQPWYVVSSPEVPSRPGLTQSFYWDRWESDRVRNGTVVPELPLLYSGGYSYIASPFLAALALEAVASGVGIAAAASVLSSKAARARRWLLPISAVLAWLGPAGFAVSFPLTMGQGNVDWPPFFASVWIGWAGVSQGYGPGFAWGITTGAAAFVTLAVLAEYLWRRRTTGAGLPESADGSAARDDSSRPV